MQWRRVALRSCSLPMGSDASSPAVLLHLGRTKDWVGVSTRLPRVKAALVVDAPAVRLSGLFILRVLDSRRSPTPSPLPRSATHLTAANELLESRFVPYAKRKEIPMSDDSAAKSSWIAAVRDLTDTSALVTVKRRDGHMVGHVVPTQFPFNYNGNGAATSDANSSA